MNTGETPCESKNGLLTTIAVGLEGKVQYALEGSVFVGGAVIQWLRDELRFFPESRGRGVLRPEGARQRGRVPGARLHGAGGRPTGICTPVACSSASPGAPGGSTSPGRPRSPSPTRWQDLARAMEADTGVPLTSLKADGGASRDGFLMQFQADILGRAVLRPAIRETTALGAAYLAGLAGGVWESREELSRLWRCDTTFSPAMDARHREHLLADWHRAVERCRGWVNQADGSTL